MARVALAESRELTIVTVFGVVVLMVFFPGLTAPLFALGLLFIRWGNPVSEWPLFTAMSHPFARFPKRDQRLKSPRDPLDRANVRQEMPFAKAIFFLGNTHSPKHRSPQLWLSDSVFRQHHTVFGTSGAGKTEKLLGYLANSLCWGSGMMFFDGKGTTEFGYKAYATAYRYGRTEDVLFLNLMTGSADLTVKTPERVSNTASIYALGPAPFITELTVSMMPEAGGDGMWKDRAIALGSAVIGLCTFDRDKKGRPFSPGKLRSALNFKSIVRRSKDTDLPPVVAASVNAYLTSLAGFDVSKGEKQDAKALEQHGFLEMQFTKILGTLADTYGHVFNHLLGEVHMRDVVVNNRILVFLLPSLEKSGHESRSLGNLGMALNRSAMATLMGFKLEGSAQLNIETLPTRASYPYVFVYDEIGYYMPKDGTAIQAAQARGLGIGVVVAAQDRTKLDQQSREETDAIIGTTRLKHFLAIENDPTFKVASEQAGQMDVAVAGGWERERGLLSNSYRKDGNVRIERRDRLTVSQIRAQRAGVGTTMYEDRVMQVDYFYPAIGIKHIDNMAINQFLEVVAPDPQELVAHTEQYAAAKGAFFTGLKKLATQPPSERPMLTEFHRALVAAATHLRSPVEQVLAAFGLLTVGKITPEIEVVAAVMPEPADRNSPEKISRTVADDSDDLFPFHASLDDVEDTAGALPIIDAVPKIVDSADNDELSTLSSMQDAYRGLDRQQADEELAALSSLRTVSLSSVRREAVSTDISPALMRVRDGLNEVSIAADLDPIRATVAMTAATSVIANSLDLLLTASKPHAVSPDAMDEAMILDALLKIASGKD